MTSNTSDIPTDVSDRTVLRTRFRLWWLRRHLLCGTHSRAMTLAAYGGLLDITGRHYVHQSKVILRESRRCTSCVARIEETEQAHALLSRARVARIAGRSEH